MMKAEIITHEGNPGPNWLDHCKNMITPGKVGLTVTFGAIIISIVAFQHRPTSTPTTASSQPATNQAQQVELSPSKSLQVAPLESQSTQAPAQQPSTNLQSTTTNSGSQIPPTSPSQQSTAPSASVPTSQTSSNKVPSVTQTLQGVQQSVQATRANLKSTLQGLGL